MHAQRPVPRRRNRLSRAAALPRERAVVIGGSMAGLLAARVLSEHFAAVTILEQDPVEDAPQARKGQPHAAHLHILLGHGWQVLNHWFPELRSRLEAAGALLSDTGLALRWYHSGGYRLRFPSHYPFIMVSRPCLEHAVRSELLKRHNVALRDQFKVTRALEDGRGAVVGVAAQPQGAAGEPSPERADLVVDASGRGSLCSRFLHQLGYPLPAETRVEVNVGYATRSFKRTPRALFDGQALVVSAAPPTGKRAASLCPVEDDRWVLGLAGWCGDHPPTDPGGFEAFLRSLPVPEMHHVVRQLEPVGDITAYRFKASYRRHYERLGEFPRGLLPIGDALAAFNPTYGQGMTVAALEAQALGQELSTSPFNARRYFRATRRIIDIPWQLSVGEDFRHPETRGRRSLATGLVNRYVTRVHRATHRDAIVYSEFIRVANLMAPPAVLMRPSIMRRVLLAR